MECKRCGRCCQYQLNGITKVCKYLIGTVGELTTCSIYSERVGTTIDRQILNRNYRNIKGSQIVKKIVCGYRKDNPVYYEGCTGIQ